MNLCSQEPLHPSAGSKYSRVMESDPLPRAESTNRSEPTTNELSTDPEIEEALRPAGL
ncbi:hypothetical protein PVL29_020903 [Vitis rotundifolia]|uniref:Uncharacterized protein n=1 Tax=Vitis rotundifolia TaxID=103349 RepID=A0AA39DCM2_VITRO|nr:hypothetical protein PVL29_020903 [Vitis rotundifolia]